MYVFKLFIWKWLRLYDILIILFNFSSHYTMYFYLIYAFCTKEKKSMIFFAGLKMNLNGGGLEWSKCTIYFIFGLHFDPYTLWSIFLKFWIQHKKNYWNNEPHIFETFFVSYLPRVIMQIDYAVIIRNRACAIKWAEEKTRFKKQSQSPGEKM